MTRVRPPRNALVAADPETRRVIAKAMSEAELQEAVIGCAKTLGWMAVHFRPAQTQRGNWVTPTQGDRGFPDCVLARGGTVLFVELKREGRLPEAHQQEWLDAIGPAACVWRPSDWLSGEIEEALR